MFLLQKRKGFLGLNKTLIQYTNLVSYCHLARLQNLIIMLPIQKMFF